MCKCEKFINRLTEAVALFGQKLILKQVPFMTLVVAIDGNSAIQTPLIQGKATPTLVIQLR